jgi:acetolactate synthase-1/2/3 large subunit
MSTMQKITVGELAARLFAASGITHAFGVISIHNMPVLDAFHRLRNMRFVPARGEAGAVNMADAATRVSGRTALAITSTGTACGNACGAMVEALTAGTPLLHLTGQIELPYLDRNLGYIHEARDQMSMLKSVSKAAYRVWRAEDALGVLKEAIRVANTAPTGPVSVEIPIDVQETLIDLPDESQLAAIAPQPQAPEAGALAALAARIASARRPLLWLGGGARGAGAAIARLLALGVGVVTSVQGRGVVAENHPLSLGAFNLYPETEAFYASCDALLVVGSRLRSNETLKYKLKLPKPLYRIDCDPQASGRAYADELFVCGDASLALAQLADHLEAARAKGGFALDPAFAADLAKARHGAEERVRSGLGPYARLVDELQRACGEDFVFVRDVTVSNSTWGNRALHIFGPRDGVHAMGGGIGMGAAMSVGAALAAAHANPKRKTLALSGDGGLMLNIGELATLKQENANVVLVVMNDRGYGVIRNIQDAQYGARRAYVDLTTPNFAQLTGSLGIAHLPLSNIADTRAVLEKAFAMQGPVMVEVDMNAIGPFASAFAGPPVKK